MRFKHTRTFLVRRAKKHVYGFRGVWFRRMIKKLEKAKEENKRGKRELKWKDSLVSWVIYGDGGKSSLGGARRQRAC